jgi:hypothetical protein
MYEPLSDSDISRFIPNIVKYSELKDINPRKLLNELPVVILYETGPNYGHWTLLHRLKNGNVEFFDSYGFKPDEEFYFIDKGYQYPHYLWKLLVDIKKLLGRNGIHYNEYHLQSSSDRRVATCGRWVILRHLFNDVDIDAFNRGVIGLSGRLGISPDELVSRIIQN